MLIMKAIKMANIARKFISPKKDKIISTEAIKRIKDTEDNKDMKLREAYKNMLKVILLSFFLTGCVSPCAILEKAEVCGTLYHGAYCVQDGQGYEYSEQEWSDKRVGRISLDARDYQKIRNNCKVIDELLE